VTEGQVNRVELLQRAREALFGFEWRQPLARALGVDGRGMRRWLAFERVVPGTVIEKLPDVLYAEAQKRRAKAHEIEVMASEIMSGLMQP
jgi:hypothetical protein